MVAAKDIVIFMKGVPTAPQCGFSNAVVQILKMHGVEDYNAHNVLEENEIREGVKSFSNWPTIPQVYFKGEFIGGCDVLLQMHQSGDIVEELQKLGIKSKLLTQAENEAKKD
ncbi:glutaredoxin-related protein 5, mitochondrial-like [Symsagittifera roscoffensis]